MDPAVIGLVSALALCVVACGVLVWLLARRSSRRADARVTGVVGTIEERMEVLARELTDAVRRAEEETRRSRLLAQVATTMDLDDVLYSAVEAAASLAGADAAVVRLEGIDGDDDVIISTGFDAGAYEGPLAQLPEDWGTRATELSFHYDPAAADAIQAALGAPLSDRGVRTGWLGVFSRRPGARFGAEDLRRLEELADQVAPAIENARRFRKARELADFDALTGLRNRRFFHETLAREVARAHRYGRCLSLVIADIDDFKAINDRIGHLGGDAVLAETGARLRQVVRATDVPCRVGGDELAVIAPEAGREQAEQLVTRIEAAVSLHPIARAGNVQVSAGVAELQPQDDATSLFERADAALYAAKNARRGHGLANA